MVKTQMGPYASQLSTTQRWMVVSYIKGKQLAKKSGGSTKPGTDSTAAKAAPGAAAGAQEQDTSATGDTTKKK